LAIIISMTAAASKVSATINSAQEIRGGAFPQHVKSRGACMN
jgi:hypothetical protein